MCLRVSEHFKWMDIVKRMTFLKCPRISGSFKCTRLKISRLSPDIYSESSGCLDGSGTEDLQVAHDGTRDSRSFQGL